MSGREIDVAVVIIDAEPEVGCSDQVHRRAQRPEQAISRLAGAAAAGRVPMTTRRIVGAGFHGEGQTFCCEARSEISP